LVLGIGAVGVAIDQVTKAVVLAVLDPAHPIPLLGGVVNLQLLRNSGAAFSMGEGLTVGLSIVAIAALVGVLVWFVPKVRHPGWTVAMGLLVAGIAGNLADRLFRDPGPFQGHVVDFIQVPYFAVFNVADICITAAAAVVIWLTLITKVGFDGIPFADTLPEAKVAGPADE
jgi:lipoprotein signal peptidase